MNHPIKRRAYLVKKHEPRATKTSSDRSFDEWVRLFLLDLRAKNLAPRTLECYESNVYDFQKAFAAAQIPIDFSTLTGNDIKRYYIGNMVDRKLAGTTINGRIKTCKAFFQFLYREQATPENLGEQLRLVKAEQPMISTFTKHQMITLLAQPDRRTFAGLRDYTMMLLLLETGLRLKEILDLHLDDVRWVDNELFIHPGKGNKARRVPFQQTCVNALRHYIRERGDLNTDVLFVTVNHTKLHARTLQEHLRDYGKSAGLRGVRVSPHTFRHTMSKFYILNGGDAFTLQQILGHSTLDMVRHYVQLFRSEVQQQHRKCSPVENMKM